METLTQAAPIAQADAPSSRDALLVRIGREYVAVWLDAVVSQLDKLDIRPLPDWRAGVSGLIRVNEQFVPLYRPEEALGIARDDATVDCCAVVIRSGTACVALAIDEALDVLAIAPESLRQPPAVIAEDGLVQALAWSGDILVSVLDPHALVASCQAGAALITV